MKAYTDLANTIIRMDEGEVYVRCDENNAGGALKSLIWTVQQMSDLISLSEESADDEAEI